MALLILIASGEAKQKKSHLTGRFLQQNALGLMTRLTDVMNDTSDNHASVQERKRRIKAMEEMLRVGKHYIRIARPQVS